MYQSEFNLLAKKYYNEYLSLKAVSSKFEPKGIFHSEMLMVLALQHYYNIEHIIESGRARGQSTEMIARICQKYHLRFDSIEFDQDSPDVVVAEKRLKPFQLFGALHYGDSFDILPNILTDNKNTMIIIDGPKGVLGLKLGLSMLTHPNIKAVLFHDSHRDATDVRPILERHFQNQLLFSDDYEWVEQFRSLDIDCWEVEKYNSGYFPYKRKENKMRSYASTLSCVLNDSNLSFSVNDSMIELEDKIKHEKKIRVRIVAKSRMIVISLIKKFL